MIALNMDDQRRARHREEEDVMIYADCPDLEYMYEHKQMVEVQNCAEKRDPDVSHHDHITSRLLEYSFPPNKSQSQSQSQQQFAVSQPPSPTTTTSPSHFRGHRRSRGLSIDSEFSNFLSNGGSDSSTRATSLQPSPMLPTKMIDLSEAEKPLVPSPRVCSFITQRSGSFTKMMDVTEENDDNSDDYDAEEEEEDDDETRLAEFMKQPYDKVRSGMKFSKGDGVEEDDFTSTPRQPEQLQPQPQSAPAVLAYTHRKSSSIDRLILQRVKKFARIHLGSPHS